MMMEHLSKSVKYIIYTKTIFKRSQSSALIPLCHVLHQSICPELRSVCVHSIPSAIRHAVMNLAHPPELGEIPRPFARAVQVKLAIMQHQNHQQLRPPVSEVVLLAGQYVNKTCRLTKLDQLVMETLTQMSG